MKKLFLIVSLALILSGCDRWCYYSFEVRNDLIDETVKLVFLNSANSGPESNKLKVIEIGPGEKKVIRQIDGQLNQRSHDCLALHGISFFPELVFDAYIGDGKIDKELWQPEYWVYVETSSWSAKYEMAFTHELLEAD